MEHNYNILKSEKDVEAAKYLVKEKMAYGMPQINASVDYKDNIARPVSLLPGEFMGQPGTDVEIQFGTRYNANVGGSLTQLIFSGEYLIGLKASKRFFEKTNVDFFKNKVALKKQVAGSYLMCLPLPKRCGLSTAPSKQPTSFTLKPNRFLKRAWPKIPMLTRWNFWLKT
jgi:hypothetical protein